MSENEQRQLFNRQIGRRSTLELLHDVVVSASRPLGPTRLMYAANLSWKPCKRIIKGAVASGFLKEEDAKGNDKRKRKTYVATEKGLAWARDFYKHAAVLHGIDDRLRGRERL